MTSTTTTRPAPQPTSRQTPAPQTRPDRRRIGAIVTGGVAVLVVAAGVVVWANSGSEPAAPTSTVHSGAAFNAADAGALVGHGTTLVAPAPPVTSSAAAGALLGHGTTIVVAHPAAPARSAADAGALVGTTAGPSR